MSSAVTILVFHFRSDTDTISAKYRDTDTIPIFTAKPTKNTQNNGAANLARNASIVYWSNWVRKAVQCITNLQTCSGKIGRQLLILVCHSISVSGGPAAILCSHLVCCYKSQSIETTLHPTIHSLLLRCFNRSSIKGDQLVFPSDFTAWFYSMSACMLSK